MYSTIPLQKNFASLGWLSFLFFILLFTPLIIRWIKKRKAAKQLNNQQKMVGEEPIVKPVSVTTKDRYENILIQIMTDYNSGDATLRESYQILSRTIRQFVLDYTGIDVTAKTLAEIRGLNVRRVESLIEEYYAAEFAAVDDSNLAKSINHAIKVIREWN